METIFTAGVLTISDKGSQGGREDVSGETAVKILEEEGFSVLERKIVPDNRQRIVDALETTRLTAVMLLPGHLLHVLCGFAYAAIVETRLRVERQDIEGNDDDYVCEFEPG